MYLAAYVDKRIMSYLTRSPVAKAIDMYVMVNIRSNMFPVGYLLPIVLHINLYVGTFIQN